MVPAMSNQESGHLLPLCPTHYERMVISPGRLESTVLPVTWDNRDWYECLVDECPQHYSPICGYFVVESNDDHWHATGSSSFWIILDKQESQAGDLRRTQGCHAP
jgi:hypothetical protein